VSKVHPSGRNARSDANIAWHSEAVGGEIGYRNSARVEAGTVGNSGVDRAHATSIQSASNRVAGSRLIEEPAISNMIDVDSHEQVRANVAEIVRAQNTALPELPLHTDVHLQRAGRLVVRIEEAAGRRLESALLQQGWQVSRTIGSV